jgi:hypothetical protein
MKTLKGKIIAVLSAIIVILGGYSATNLGSVVQNSQYDYTQLSGSVASTTANVNVGKTTLGSIIVTEDQAVAVDVYDATSTAAITDGTYATKVAVMEAAQAEGTYTFDTGLTYGLVLNTDDWTAFAGDWTVTYRLGW